MEQIVEMGKPVVEEEFEHRWTDIASEVSEELKTETTTETIEPVSETNQNYDFAFGLLTGFLGGLFIGLGMWFKERRMRLALLKEVELLNKLGAAKKGKKDLVEYDEETIKIAEKLLAAPESLIEEIKINIEKHKWVWLFNKGEKNRWMNAMENLITLSAAFQADISNEAYETLAKNIKETETIKEK